MDNVTQAARALIECIETNNFGAGKVVSCHEKLIPHVAKLENELLRLLKGSTEYKALKEAVEPTREEIADYLERYNKWRRGGDYEQPAPKELGEMINQAIKELRKDG